MPYDSQHDAATPSDSSHPLAPWQHTAAILVLFVVWTILGSQRAQDVASGEHLLRYLSSIMGAWMTLGTVIAGVYHRRRFFYDTLQRNARPWYKDLRFGILIYFAVIVIFGIAHTILQHTSLAQSVDRSVVLAISPQTGAELVMWFFVSLSAAFCEEHIFRGYLLPQVASWCGSAGASRSIAFAISVITTSILFGVLHLYQGVGGAIMITLLGAFYALVSQRLGNLRALIVAHFLQDFVTGTVLFARHLHTP